MEESSMNLKQIIDKINFLSDDEEIMDYIRSKERAHEDFNGSPLPWNARKGWTVQEVLDAQNKALEELHNESTGETLDRSDFSDAEWAEWIEDILQEESA
jgi:hypothetical protein